MTDLEDLWATYPTSEPPVVDLLRRGRTEARVRRRRRLVRPLLAGAVAAGVASAFVVGARLDGRSGLPRAGSAASRDSGVAAPPLRHSAFQADLQPAASCEGLLASYRARAVEQAGPYGWRMPAVRDQVVHGGVPLAVAGSVAGLFASGVGSSATGTNVQEQGVDEPDEVKTDGSLLVRIRGAKLSVYDVSGASVRRTARLELPDLTDGRLLLSGRTLVVLGSDTARRTGGVVGARVETVSLADPAHPVVTAQVRYSGTVASARQYGATVRVVLSDTVLPDLPFVHPRGGLSRHDALAHNRRLARATTLDDWLPWYDDGTGRRPLLACDRVALPPAGVPLGTTSIVGLEAASPTQPDALGLAGLTDDAYASADHLYLTTSDSPDDLCADCVPLLADAEYSAQTHIFQFDLHGTAATHVATGLVAGRIADRWSMDEHDGVLRTAVGVGSPTTPSTSIITLRPKGTDLVEIGRLDGLGINQMLTAARWFDDLAILSTARRSDPLYTIDLADPVHPKLRGALHIPGFSSYLHPIGNGRLLAVGQQVSAQRRSAVGEQARVGLFDIGDLTDVRQVATASPRTWTWPRAGEDPRAFTWLPDRSIALTTFGTRSGGVLLGEYRVEDATLTQRLTRLPVRAGAQVRTLKVGSGRVVLVAGGHVSFLAL